MPHTPNYAEICPVDPDNPFRNPTEQPDYSPDYSEIMPEIEIPDSFLPLYPSAAERTGIRRYFTLTFLMLLFDFVTAATIFVALQLIVTTVLKQSDLRTAGTLPQNYPQIVQQFLSDSSVSYAMTLIAFLIANTVTFLVGCKLTNLRPKSMFRVREYTFPRSVMYILIGLWIQLLSGIASEHLLPLLKNAGLPVSSPEITLDGFTRRTAMIILYACIVAPVTEELVLRGLVLKNLSRVSQRFGIILSALLFGLMHDNLLQFLFTFPLGLLLGCITVRHNSLTPAIIVHVFVNTAAVGILLCRQLLSAEAYRIFDMSYTLGVFALGAVALLVFLVTEKIPDSTPHQRTRSGRIAVTSPLLWLVIGSHIAACWYLSK
ncbi:MAG: CPBP family intramembrane metalloprotease [Oscillospiraceae bacterium]|nr:CPBP family intramembrane metalloprotease [Oscillospiraceae bacterium]